MPLSIATGRFSGRAHVIGVKLAPVVAIAIALALAAQAAVAQPPSATTPPSPTRFVTDGAGFLSAPAQEELEQRLARYAQDTGHQVLLWIGQTTGGEPIESWAVRAFAAWRVGRKGLDDGVAVFILAADRRVRIEVGYGLEDRLPDAVAARIIGDEMIPRLRAGDRDGAARAGVSGVLAAVGGEVGAPREGVPTAFAPEIDKGRLIVLGIIGILVLGFLVTHPRLALMLLMTLDSHGHRGGWRGGGWGGGFGGGFGGGGWGGGGFGGGGGFSGGGGRSGGGGASGSW